MTRPAPSLGGLGRRRVLIVHSGGLGDFVLTFPLAVALARIHPTARITYVTHAAKGRLAARAIGVEWTDLEAGWHALYADPARLPAPARRLLEGAHTILSFLSAPGDAWSTAAAAIAGEGAAVYALRPTPPPDWTDHASAFLLQQTQPLPVLHAALAQILRSAERNGLGAARPTGAAGPVVVHPGSGGAGKCWSRERYVELLQRLAADGTPARLLVGEVERERWGERALRDLAAVAPLAEPPDLLALLEELRCARAFVGNDSGPAHLAGLIGLPTLALFGPTDPAVWRPLGPAVRTLHHPELATLGVDRVYDALKALPDRPPTGRPPAGDDPD